MHTRTLTHVRVSVVKRRSMTRAAGAAAGCLLSLGAMALLLSLALSRGDQDKVEGESRVLVRLQNMARNTNI